jgi:hypothetical protein
MGRSPSFLHLTLIQATAKNHSLRFGRITPSVSRETLSQDSAESLLRETLLVKDLLLVRYLRGVPFMMIKYALCNTY